MEERTDENENSKPDRSAADRLADELARRAEAWDAFDRALIEALDADAELWNDPTWSGASREAASKRAKMRDHAFGVITFAKTALEHEHLYEKLRKLSKQLTKPRKPPSRTKLMWALVSFCADGLQFMAYRQSKDDGFGDGSRAVAMDLRRRICTFIDPKFAGQHDDILSVIKGFDPSPPRLATGRAKGGGKKLSAPQRLAAEISCRFGLLGFGNSEHGSRGRRKAAAAFGKITLKSRN